MCQVTEFDRPHSAYMLFYERNEELEPIEKLLQASVPSVPTPENTPASGPLSKGLEVGFANTYTLHAAKSNQHGGYSQAWIEKAVIPLLCRVCRACHLMTDDPPFKCMVGAKSRPSNLGGSNQACWGVFAACHAVEGFLVCC